MALTEKQGGSDVRANTTRAVSDGDATEYSFRRLATAVTKFWVCKRGPNHAYEAMECLGGNGYTEDFPLAMRYREQPVMAIWEGTGNVIALDVLRALGTDPGSIDAFLAGLECRFNYGNLPSSCDFAGILARAYTVSAVL